MILRHYPLPDLDQAQRLLELIFSGVPAVPPEYHDTEVILYGAGNLGRMACEFLDYVGVRILHAYDRVAKDGDTLGGSIPVYQPSEPGVHGNHLILVTTLCVPYTEIETFLSSLGWKRILPFYDYALQYSEKHPLSNGWFSGPLSHEDREMIREMLSTLGDQHSYAAYLQFLAWRVLREDWIFEGASVRMDDRFFIEPICNVLTDHEIFLDVGAHHGEVFEKFVTVTEMRFLSAYLFEPDNSNFLELQKNIKNLPQDVQKKTTLLQKAVGIKNETSAFCHSFGYASRLWNSASGETNVIRLDDFRIPVSFLKLHIEGGEHAALEGARDTLKTYRPIITATVYHNNDGLWKIMFGLEKILRNYFFILRMHSWCGTGVVMYWIPLERNNVE